MDKKSLSERDIFTKFIKPAIVKAGFGNSNFRLLITSPVAFDADLKSIYIVCLKK